MPESANIKIIFSLENDNKTGASGANPVNDYTILKPDIDKSKLSKSASKIIPIAKVTAKRRNLNSDCNFQNLVVGKHNELSLIHI